MRHLLLIAGLNFVLATSIFSQNLKPGYFGEEMPNFKLKTLQGNDLSISDLRGKNSIIIFLRGKVMDNLWCGLCMYQYAEMAELEIKESIRKKYNLEVVFVVQFDADSAKKWIKGFPERLARIEQWKYPVDTININPATRDWMKFCRKHYPKKFVYTIETVPTILPIMLDVNMKVSKGLEIYRYEWDGTKTDQNIPSIFILDKNGIIRYKYHSQTTQDRPNAEYLIEIVKQIRN